MTTTNDRRRNAYPGNCCVCSSAVAAGDGWLYSDTKPSRVMRSGRFPKKVKCDRCHQNKLTHKWQVENLENPAPSVRRWSVTDVSKWPLEVEVVDSEWAGEYLGVGKGYERVFGKLVAVHVTVNGERVELAGGDYVLNRQQGPWYGYEDKGIGGRPFTPAAWKRLTERVYEAIAANSKPKA